MANDLLKATSEQLLSVIIDAKERFSVISEEDWSRRPAPGKWSKKEILGHLIDSATNNHQRFVRAQLADDTFIGPSYEQDLCVSVQNYQRVSTKDLIDLWFAYNTLLVHVIAHANPLKLSVTCLIGNYDPVSFSFVITDYVDHMIHHLKQITPRG